MRVKNVLSDLFLELPVLKLPTAKIVFSLYLKLLYQNKKVKWNPNES